MSLVDYIVLGGYLLATLAVALAIKTRARGFREFSIAGGTVGWWPMGMSIMASAFSVVNYTAFPEEALGHGLYVWLVFPALAVSAAVVCAFIIPFYHKFQPVSAYEFLEKRFDVRVRRLAAGMFMIWRIAWMSVVLYAAGSLIGAVSGLSFWMVVWTCFAISVLYSAVGGIRAIIHTDVLQLLVIMAGILLAVYVFAGMADPRALLRAAREAGQLRPFAPADGGVWSPSPFIRMSVWSCMIGGTTAFLTRYGVDQVIVQRYFTVGSVRDAQKGFILNIVLLVASLVVLTFLGIAVAGRVASGAGPESASRYPVLFLAQFIASLPRGMVGLIVGGLFASAMSSLDSAMHSCATSLVTDFGSRPPAAADSLVLKRARAMTVIFGLLAVLMTLAVSNLGTIFEAANKVVNALGSPILALFVLAWLRGARLSSRGVLLGGILGSAWSMYVSFFVQGLSLHYYAFINFAGTLLLAGCLGFAVRDSGGGSA